MRASAEGLQGNKRRAALKPLPLLLPCSRGPRRCHPVLLVATRGSPFALVRHVAASERLRVLSLFDGISCARVDRGARRVAAYYASEVDPDPIACSRANWRDAKHVGDVRALDPSDVQGLDLLIGGSPCQDLSSANPNRRGLEGPAPASSGSTCACSAAPPHGAGRLRTSPA